jgi:hypothetical protein
MRGARGRLVRLVLLAISLPPIKCLLVLAACWAVLGSHGPLFVSALHCTYSDGSCSNIPLWQCSLRECTSVAQMYVPFALCAT